VRFWDASAIVGLVIDDPFSEQVQRWHRDDPEVTAWCLSPVEVWSAVARRRREGLIRSPEIRSARQHLADLASVWHEVDDIPAVRQRAFRLLEVHQLRAGDALQLAAALVVVGDRTTDETIVTTDSRLAKAADAEGFRVIGVEPE
jgi:predicted nucleic acid-binding protein